MTGAAVPGLTLEWLARDDRLWPALARIDDYARERALPKALAAKLMVIVEELFTNTVRHGYRGECDRPVRLSLTNGPAAPEPGLELVYEDWAPPFDPTAFDWRARLEAPAEGRAVGGAGIALVLGLAEAAAYERSDGRNRLTLIVRA